MNGSEADDDHVFRKKIMNEYVLCHKTIYVRPCCCDAILKQSPRPCKLSAVVEHAAWTTAHPSLSEEGVDSIECWCSEILNPFAVYILSLVPVSSLPEASHVLPRERLAEKSDNDTSSSSPVLFKACSNLMPGPSFLPPARRKHQNSTPRDWSICGGMQDIGISAQNLSSVVFHVCFRSPFDELFFFLQPTQTGGGRYMGFYKC